MSMTDPIADLLTRMRNVNRIGRRAVSAPYSKVKEEILKTFQREGFIDGYELGEDKAGFKTLNIQLRFGPEGEPVIRTIERVSTPGCRVYKKVDDIHPVLKGMGILILSTAQGVLSDNEARFKRVGGEVLCKVY